MRSSGKEPNKLRLQVFLSHNGVCSRRQAMDVIKQGRVKLNGQICCEPSTPVNPGRDHVFVDGKRVQGKQYDYIVLNKPAEYTTTKSDRHAEKTVIDLLPGKYKHLSPVGRLDQDTEGLLLLTNDGDVAYRLTHPKFNIDKTYFVRIAGQLEGRDKQKLEKGIVIEGKKTAPCRIKDVKACHDKTELTITIHEGRKRQIRLMFAAVGHKVIYLKRLSQGPLALGAMNPGEWSLLSKKEIERLKQI